MKNTKRKLIFIATMMLSISGCSSSDSGSMADPQITSDGAVTADTAGDATNSEVSISTATSGSLAVPVMPLSSSQMDAFVRNPLVATIPDELNGSSSAVLSRRYITNPLVN